jgi:hypothetical protein
MKVLLLGQIAKNVWALLQAADAAVKNVCLDVAQG